VTVDLRVELFGTTFRNPVLLASGTCGFGRELESVVALDRLGGIVTKSVTLEPRWGNPAPRVTEFPAGMLNSVGLANPGARAVLDEKLPWIRDHLEGTRVFVSVAGHTVQEFLDVVEILDRGEGFLGFEINLSCPNDARRSGLPFSLDPEASREVVTGVRARTSRPILAKLAPNIPDPEPVIRAVDEAGADGLTLVNTLPGLVLGSNGEGPVLGAGSGGVSGPALRTAGVNAVWRARLLTDLPLIGVGGIAGGGDALQYLLAGASLVQVGTASFWDPRSAERVVRELDRLGRSRGSSRITEVTGAAHA
jgi:dihydroorotate dehydrogenase (NAD+) catalytic subunit